MGQSPVDRNREYMREMWGPTKLVSDSGSMQHSDQKRVLTEVMNDTAPRHDLKKQTELHEKIRNDEDYDDWSYGTEPTYGNPWV